jgi:hypothetical protein
VAGSGPRRPDLGAFENRRDGVALIVCNRVIEVARAHHWVWVDRFHYERSKWHPNARRATRHGPSENAAHYDPEVETFGVARKLPCGEHELYLSGGTLTVAAHLAITLGARRVVFTGCDAWTPGRDRYHGWDGAPLGPAGRREHEDHLARTAAGIRELARFYPGVEFLDATTGPRHLGWPFVELKKLIPKQERKPWPRNPPPSPPTSASPSATAAWSP